jgi:hypothetical protein
VQNNKIGTNAAATAKIPNSGVGVLVQGRQNQIGGNTISGNGRGLEIRADPLTTTGADLNSLTNNFIGVGNTGSNNLGNDSEGVLIATSRNSIGSTTGNSANRIAFNGYAGAPGHRAGVVVEAGNRNRISSSIFANAELGIDLTPTGVTPNDSGDTDTGPNELQNFPVLSAAEAGDGMTTVTGTLDSQPSTTYTLELYVSGGCDPSGFGEGNARIFSGPITTDSSGHAAFTRSAPPQLPVGQQITATATDPAGNTSEHSQCRAITAAPAAFSGFQPQF